METATQFGPLERAIVEHINLSTETQAAQRVMTVEAIGEAINLLPAHAESVRVRARDMLSDQMLDLYLAGAGDGPYQELGNFLKAALLQVDWIKVAAHCIEQETLYIAEVQDEGPHLTIGEVAACEFVAERMENLGDTWPPGDLRIMYYGYAQILRRDCPKAFVTAIADQTFSVREA